jgi:hypothetical protein
MHETIKFYDMVLFALSDELALKRHDKNLRFASILRLFFRTIDGLVRYGTIRCAKKFG